MVYEEPTFFIKGGDVGFADRQKQIFNVLTVEEKNRNERQEESDHQSQNSNTVSVRSTVPSLRRCRSEMKQYRGKESIFKKPDAPAPRFKNKGVPDYHKNPHKWIKYSLGDVSSEDMSDRSNTAAALLFLKEMQERKRIKEMEVDSVPDQITFKQPVNKGGIISQQGTSLCNFSDVKGRENETDEAKSFFRSSKLIMPEYIIGMPKKKDKKKHEKLDHSPQNENNTSKIKLQHLTEDDDGK
jgi:hypothetical protein